MSSLRERMYTNRLTMRELSLYDICHSNIQKIQMNRRNDKFIGRKSEGDYVESAKAMIWLEEIEQSKTVKKFNQTNVRVFKNVQPVEKQFYCFENDMKMEEISNAFNKNSLERFILRKMFTKNAVGIQGRIKSINAQYINIEFENVTTSIDLKAEYEIDFTLNRLPYQVQHLALEFFQNHKLFDKFINNPLLDSSNVSNHSMDTTAEFSSDESELFSELNEEQRGAVENIIAGNNQPLPYILFGPPGTGKTATLVAAIEKIVRSTGNNVLVCSNSNTACDEITSRLLNILTENELLRFYTRTHDHRKINSEIKPYSNFHENVFHFPALNHLLEFRVIVCTLCTASFLTRSQVHPNAFSHIIIDECASTHETMAMVAIAGLCTDNDGIKSSIVLAGDHKQLDAVTMSKEAADLGFKTSLMEHLLKRRLYQRDPITGKYNAKFITQLVKNYRSHSAILHMPSKLFYDGSLQAKASSDIADWFIGSTILPSKNIPIIFHDVRGFCKSGNGSSVFNEKEFHMVVDYIVKLLKLKQKYKCVIPSDIGVVAPYKLQCNRISQAIRLKHLGDITVGTAEMFQGQERPIMIVSTVRSNGRGLGFVNDPRRLNVMITRAKSLLIIVGNQSTLSQDKKWAEMIKFCRENGAMVSE